MNTSDFPAGLHGYIPALNPTMSIGFVAEWLLANVSPATSDPGLWPVVVSIGVVVLMGVVDPLVGFLLFRGADLG